MRIKQLIEALGNPRVYGTLNDFEVRGISCNSKNIAEGFVFVAISGPGNDGHDFIHEAVERSAGAVVAERNIALDAGSRANPGIVVVDNTRMALVKLAAEFYGNPAAGIEFTGVTGTNGKTTITYLIEALLKKAGRKPAVIGTVNYRFDGNVIPAKNTTPGALELQSLFSRMRDSGVKHCVMEVSSHALEQGRVEGIDFRYGIFTNLTQDHLDYHHDLENYFLAKAKLFQGLTARSCAIINRDDLYARKLVELTPAKVVTYGIQAGSDCRASGIKLGHSGSEFKVTAFGKTIDLKSRLIGEHNVYNLLAAVAWAFQEGMDRDLIRAALEDFVFVPGRLEAVEHGGDFRVFVDYAHTEDALSNVLRALRGIAPRKIIVVFGCGGERDRGKRPKMGKAATELADYVIVTSDNPRSEDPLCIIAEIKKGIVKDNYCVIPERGEAVKKAVSLAAKGDIVLIAGKGHEDYQIFKGETVHFDDREAARACLRSLKY